MALSLGACAVLPVVLYALLAAAAPIRGLHWPALCASLCAALLLAGFLLVNLSRRHLRALASARSREAQLYTQAHYDPLTGLANRRLFRERLSTQVAAADAHGALLYIDLDEFKQVNDSVGHAAGDQLLAIAAQRLRASVADGDTVARLGGDEFAVILPGVAAADAAGVAARIVESLQRPVAIGDREHFVRASVGVALYPAEGTTPEALLQRADAAMYQAKGLGRARARTRRRLGRAAGVDGVLQLDFLHEHRSSRGEDRAA